MKVPRRTGLLVSASAMVWSGLFGLVLLIEICG